MTLPRFLALCLSAVPVFMLALSLYFIFGIQTPFAIAFNRAEIDSASLSSGDSGELTLTDFDESGSDDALTGPEDIPDVDEGPVYAQTPLVSGWSITVGDEKTATLASVEQAYAVLEDVKKHYYPEGNELNVLNVEFVEPVEIFAETVPISCLYTPELAFTKLTEGRENEIIYKVVKGDNYWTIAKKFDMDPEELKLINNAPNDKLQIGQLLRINCPQPVLSVKTSYTALIEEKIPFETVIKENSSAWESQTKVLTPGVTGIREVRYEIAQVNGVLVERKALEETVISDPVSQVTEKGTKRIVASRSDPSASQKSGNGTLKWPVIGRINSPFGKRGSGYHSGIDIAAKVGDPVYSAAAGTVIAASSYHAYGQRIIIDHGNGLTTWYAHLSGYSVMVGQTVGELELIGLVGRTGRTTGPHLHFELRLDGKTENPVHYLN